VRAAFLLKMGVDKKSRSKDVISREYTINLHKALHGVTFKKRAPKAVRAVRALQKGLHAAWIRWRAGYKSRARGEYHRGSGRVCWGGGAHVWSGSAPPPIPKWLSREEACTSRRAIAAVRSSPPVGFYRPGSPMCQTPPGCFAAAVKPPSVPRTPSATVALWMAAGHGACCCRPHRRVPAAPTPWNRGSIFPVRGRS